MVMEGAPMTVDLNGDGDAEIITAAYENLIAFDGDGKELWRFDARGRYSTCPAIWERDGQPPLIYAGDNTGEFTCVDGSGNVVWQVETKPIFCASPAVGDLDGDGASEVVQGDKSGIVYAFDALTGKVKWQTQIDGECSSPSLADLNGDKKIETIIGTGAGKVYAVDAMGEVSWTSERKGTTPDWATCSPIAFCDAREQWRVLWASGSEHVHCLDQDGKTIWQRPTRGAVASTLSAGDIDGDGQVDLLAVTQLGVVYRFDEDGGVVWEIDSQGRSLAPGALIDVDGDGACEYALCTQSGNLLVFDRSGALQRSHQFDNRTINVTPAFGDVVREREGLEFAVTGGESGRLFCFDTGASVDTISHWAGYRGNRANTAAWRLRPHSSGAIMTPTNLMQEDIVSGDVIHFEIANAQDGILTAEAVCFRPNGTQQRALSRATGTNGMLDLPLTVTSPGAHRFEWSLKDARGAELTRGSREIALTPFENDLALAKRASDALRTCTENGEPGPNEASFRAALALELSEFERDASELSTAQDFGSSATPDAMADAIARAAALNARSRRNIALASLAEAVPKDRECLIAFENSALENRDTDLRLPLDSATPLPITRRSVTGEHEPVAIKLFNASNKSVVATVRVTPESQQVRVNALASKSAPTNLGDTAWDPLVPVDETEFSIPKLKSRELWLDIDLVHASPGTTKIVMACESGAARADVEIILDVLPISMAGYDRMRMCAWAQYSEHAMKDLLAHGNTVFIGSLPPATVAAGAAPAITCDFVALDEFLAPLKGHDVYLLFHGIPQLGVPMESEEYVPRFAEYMKLFFEHLAANGFDEGHVALYPYDEPGGNGWNVVKQYTAFARQALKARSGLNFYVNGGADLAMFEEMAEYAGVWSPSFYMLPEQSPEMAVLRKSGETLWSYDCAYAFSRPVGANTKTINIVAQYRLSAIIAMNYGATGIGWWCYNHGPSMWEPIQYEYPLVYTNEDGTITTSRRWEAVREGVEDARILIALRDKLADDSVSAEAKGKIRTLLEKTVPELSHQTMEEARLGVARYVIDATHNDKTVERLRAEMMDCVEAVGK